MYVSKGRYGVPEKLEEQFRIILTRHLSPRRKKLPRYPAAAEMTDEKYSVWKWWFGIFNRLKLSEAEYLNYYDLVFDTPEEYVLRKDGKVHYAFFADIFDGLVELRGLEKEGYRVYDYVTEAEIDRVRGPMGMLDVSFEKFLLIECTKE